MPDYQVGFTEECKRKLERLASPEALDEVLATVLRDLGNDPYAFKSTLVINELGERKTSRFVKTEFFVSEVGVVQPLTLFFGIIESRKQVLILDLLPSSGFGMDPDSP